MKACVFVDGENFRYSVNQLIDGTRKTFDYLPSCDWGLFFDSIIRKCYQAERLRVYWYSVPKIIFKPDALYKHGKFEEVNGVKTDLLEACVKKHGTKELKEDLASTCKRLCERQTEIQKRFDGWKRQEDGIASKNEGIEFRRAGVVKFNLFTDRFEDEKEIDVKLAIDLLELRNIYDVAILISGDQDFVPAIKIVKDSGKKVANINFKTRGGNLLTGWSYALNVFCDKTVVVPYSEIEKLI